MTRIPFLILLAITTITSHGQDAGAKLKKSWIKTSVENLAGGETKDLDTLYIRYTFDEADLRISFYPGWDDYRRPWSAKDGLITIGYDIYRIETLTDSSLTIAEPGFQRIKFLSENYLTGKKENLDSVGEYNGKPLYKANKFITPRYKKESLRDFIDNGLNEGNRAAYFLISFIVTEEGKIENIQVVKSISKDFDKQVAKRLLKTSNDWQPAFFQGNPIQTQMFYDIKYLHFAGQF